MTRLMVITSSTRPGRAGDKIAGWITNLAQGSPFEVDAADLRAVDLPLLDEPEHPAARRYTQPHTIRWSNRVDRADAVVIVTPEYNHSFPASLKNALDFLYSEWQNKPVGVVSYGGVSAGTRAAAALAPVLSSLKMRPIGAVHLNLAEHRDNAGRFAATAEAETAALEMLDSLNAALAPTVSGMAGSR